MQLSLASCELHPRRAFRISRARRTAVENVFVRLEHEGVAGYGEASPNSFYEETAEQVYRKLLGAENFVRGLRPTSPAEIAKIWQAAWPLLAPSRAAQCALDLALWDWLARAQGKSVAELAWGEAPRPVPTFLTIGLSTPEELTEKLTEVAGAPWLKLKSDATGDLEPLRAARARGHAHVAIDANCAWPVERLLPLAEAAAAGGAEFLEQPLAPAQNDLLIRGSLALPVMADESCVVEEDVPRAAEFYDGFNIKLVKCGGLTPGLRMVQAGRAAGLKVMVGCMLESSLLIAAGAVIAQQTDYADLDGAWLLGDDPFAPLPIREGYLHPAPGAGFGILPSRPLFT